MDFKSIFFFFLEIIDIRRIRTGIILAGHEVP